MQRRSALGLLMSAPMACVQANNGARPAVSAGRIERLASFGSKHVEARHVDVWLPPGYDGRRPHAVLYAHDGQMLFDPADTWTRRAWRLDRALAPLLARGALPDLIVVGVWNHAPLRHAEYFPQAALAHLQPDGLRERFLREALKGRPLGDAYLAFLVDELKPAIDARFATRPGREHTWVMGSSMGGLASLYALCRQPQVFSAAGCLSTHWIGTFERNTEIPSALLTWLRERAPDPASVRLYVDRGTEGLDALYDVALERARDVLADRGYRAPGLQAKVVAGTGHDEDAWGARVADVVTFLAGSAGRG